MAYILGIDVGSGYSKAVVCEDGIERAYAPSFPRVGTIGAP